MRYIASPYSSREEVFLNVEEELHCLMRRYEGLLEEGKVPVPPVAQADVTRVQTCYNNMQRFLDLFDTSKIQKLEVILGKLKTVENEISV